MILVHQEVRPASKNLPTNRDIVPDGSLPLLQLGTAIYYSTERMSECLVFQLMWSRMYT
jgi:hypothetical protein